MPPRRKRTLYHVRPGLRDILKETGISRLSGPKVKLTPGVPAFCKAAGISHSTYLAVCHGTPHPAAQFVSGEIREKVLVGVVAICGEEYRARAEALWDPIPKAEIRINGDKLVQTRLRALAKAHGLTPFEYVAKLLEGPRDPLDVLALKTGGRRK